MTLEELEKRTGVMEDIEEIKKLQMKYVNCLTTANWDGAMECFAEDITADLEALEITRGKNEVEKLLKEVISVHHIGQEGNFCVHPIITVDGDKAKGNFLLYIQFAKPRKVQPTILFGEDPPDWMQGYYDMEYVKKNGQWKISLLKWRFRLKSPMEPPAQI